MSELIKTSEQLTEILGIEPEVVVDRNKMSSDYMYRFKINDLLGVTMRRYVYDDGHVFTPEEMVVQLDYDETLQLYFRGVMNVDAIKEIIRVSESLPEAIANKVDAVDASQAKEICEGQRRINIYEWRPEGTNHPKDILKFGYINVAFDHCGNSLLEWDWGIGSVSSNHVTVDILKLALIVRDAAIQSEEYFRKTYLGGKEKEA